MSMIASTAGELPGIHPDLRPLRSRPVFRVAPAGLDPRDLKLVGIVFRHSAYNKYDFRLLENLDLAHADILLVNPFDPAGLQAILAAGSVGRRIATVSAVPPGAQAAARHRIALDQLTMQLLPVLNRVVETETLVPAPVEMPPCAAGSPAAAGSPGSSAGSGGAVVTAAKAGEAAAGEAGTCDAANGEAAAVAAGKAAALAIAAARRMPADPTPPTGSQEVVPSIGQFHQAPPRARLQVVVADPSLPAQQQLTRALHRMGLAVHCVAGTLDALQRLSAQHADLVITESGLSDGHGFELIRLLRAQPGHRYTPVLLLRSRLHPMDATRARLAGEVMLLTKPLTRQALESVVRQALRRSVVLDDLNELLAPG